MPIFDAARGEHGERPAELDGKGWANRHVPIPRPDHPPMDGYRYTWEDDALNIRMREEEAKRPYGVLPTLAGKAQPKWDDPGRCRGFSKENVRPCRAWAQRNVEGNYTRFCLKHSETSKKRMGKEAAHLTTPAMVVSGASRNARHGAYSAVIRQQLTEILDSKEGGKEREDLLTLMESMDAVNTDNPAESLDFAIKVTMGLYASMLTRHAKGELKFGDFLIGTQLVNDSLRKLIGTKHDVLGTADDETERAVNAVLERFGLGPGQAPTSTSLGGTGVRGELLTFEQDDEESGQDMDTNPYGYGSVDMDMEQEEQDGDDA
jgi:hypothetical protein